MRTGTLPHVSTTLLLFASLAVIPACSSEPQGVAKDATIIGLADSGTLVRLAPEQQLVVKLNSNPTTGYQWEINHTIDQTILLPDGSRFKQSSRQRSQNDEVGTQFLRFIAQQPGRTRLELVYVRPQIGTLPDSPKYDVEVIVAPQPSTSE